MQHVNELPGEINDFDGREAGAVANRVYVSAYGGHGSERLQGFNDFSVADISRMEDVIDAT